MNKYYNQFRFWKYFFEAWSPLKWFVEDFKESIQDAKTRCFFEDDEECRLITKELEEVLSKKRS